VSINYVDRSQHAKHYTNTMPSLNMFLSRFLIINSSLLFVSHCRSCWLLQSTCTDSLLLAGVAAELLRPSTYTNCVRQRVQSELIVDEKRLLSPLTLLYSYCVRQLIQTASVNVYKVSLSSTKRDYCRRGVTASVNLYKLRPSTCSE